MRWLEPAGALAFAASSTMPSICFAAEIVEDGKDIHSRTIRRNLGAVDPGAICVERKIVARLDGGIHVRDGDAVGGWRFVAIRAMENASSARAAGGCEKIKREREEGRPRGPAVAYEGAFVKACAEQVPGDGSKQVLSKSLHHADEAPSGGNRTPEIVLQWATGAGEWPPRPFSLYLDSLPPSVTANLHKISDFKVRNRHCRFS